jgi:hypothetical protein
LKQEQIVDLEQESSRHILKNAHVCSTQAQNFLKGRQNGFRGKVKTGFVFTV